MRNAKMSQNRSAYLHTGDSDGSVLSPDFSSAKLRSSTQF